MILKFFRFLILGIIFYTVPILAKTESCSYVRLDENGGPFGKLPIYNQKKEGIDDSGLCFAISASELIDAKRIIDQKFNGKRTDPLAISVNWINGAISSEQVELTNNRELTQENIRKNIIGQVGITAKLFGNFGRISQAINLNRDRLVCDNAWMMDNPLMPAENSDQFLSDMYSLVDTQISAGRETEKVYQKLDDILSNKTLPCKTNGTIPDQIHKIMAAVKLASEQIAPEMQAKIFIDKFCSGHTLKVDVPEAQEYQCIASSCKIEEKRKLLEIIDSKDFAGVGIHYNPKILLKNKNTDSSHVSVIIGRRFNKYLNQCEVLIRDSYGTTCESPIPKVEYKSCAGGQHWISIDTVVEATVSLTHF